MATSTVTLVALALERDDLAGDRLLVAVEVLDEVDDPALVVELGLVPLAALVDQRDPQAAGQERRVAHALLERGEVEIERLEHVRVGQERDRGPGLLGRLALLQVAQRLAALVGLRPDEPVAANLDVEALGQRVDDRYADAVQAAGDLVAAALAELAAGVQHGEHDLDRRPLLLLHDRHRDAAAVVAHRDRVVRMDRDVDVVAVARESLVDRVVHDLVDEVVQARAARSSRCTCPVACVPPPGPPGP